MSPHSHISDMSHQKSIKIKLEKRIWKDEISKDGDSKAAQDSSSKEGTTKVDSQKRFSGNNNRSHSKHNYIKPLGSIELGSSPMVLTMSS